LVETQDRLQAAHDRETGAVAQKLRNLALQLALQ
jgi:hypothetical protein